ncbi:O-antigen ligase family protein [Vibrio cholerae]
MNEKIIKSSIFLTISLLLVTPNYSVIIVGILLLYSCIYLTKNDLNFGKADIIPLLTLGSFFLSNIPISFFDGETLRYLDGGLRILLCIPIYFFLKDILITNIDIQPSLCLSSILGAWGAFVFSIYQFFILDMSRVDGFLFSINFGYLSGALCILCFGLYQMESKFKNYLLISAGVALIAVVLTLTRGAILALPLVLILFFTLNTNKINTKKSIFLTIISLSVFVLSYQLSPRIKDRVDYTIFEISNIAHNNIKDAPSSGGRIQLWYAAVEAFKQNPIFGSTHKEREILNVELFKEGKINEWTSGVSRGHAHSQYFETLASNGVLGIFSLFCMLILPFLYFLFDYLKTSCPISQTGYLFVFGFILFCLTEAPLQANLISTFYGFMMALFYAYVVAKREREK